MGRAPWPGMGRWSGWASAVVAVLAASPHGAEGQGGLGCTNTTTGSEVVFDCNATTDCCPSSAPVCNATICVSECVLPLVRDVRYGSDDQCIPLQGGCGDNCVDCPAGPACRRCRSDPLYMLENGVCVANCTTGQTDTMQFVPLVNVTCSPAPPPTFAPVGPSPTPQPTARPTRLPTPLPSGSPTSRPTTRAPTTRSPTRVPTSAAPTGTRVRPSSSDSSSPLDDTPTVVVIAVCAGSVILLAAFTACYVCRDRCKSGARYRPPPPEAGRTDMGIITNNASYFMDSGGSPPVRATPSPYLDTRKDESPSPSPKGRVMDDDSSYLTGPEAAEFAEWLATLRKERRAFAMLHAEMRDRQKACATAAERLRFAPTLNNFNRLHDLFVQRKGQVKAPLDGMQLLDWAQKTIDRFNDEK